MKFYVYTLINPLTGKVFYVGKGSGDRMFQHEREARRNPSKYCKTPKQQEILKILNAGESVIASKVKSFACEQEALDFEAEMIIDIGMSNLTNVMSKGALSAAKERAGVMLGRSFADACFGLPNARHNHELCGLKAVDVHSMITNIYSSIRTKPNFSGFILGLSEKIERRYSGICSEI